MTDGTAPTGSGSASCPTPPDALPKYLAEGLPKQDTDTLEVTVEYLTALLEYRRQAVAQDDLPADAEPVADETDKPGTIVAEKVKCGDETCHCADGEKHGPYKYRYWYEDGKVKSEYIGKVESE